MVLTIYSVSDAHLGYENSDSDAFSSFLDHLLQNANEEDTLVLNGDIVDLWRRDSIGAFLQFHDIIEKILTLREKRKVNIRATFGNHDYHLKKFDDDSYPLKFEEDIVINDSGKNYRFIHGMQFDLLQDPIAMELLCHSSNKEGEDLSKIWSEIQKVPKFGNEVKNFIEKEEGGIIKHLQKLPHDRLKSDLSEVERRANANIKGDEILVFGHTHKPFVNEKRNLANSGSWVKDEKTHNTYIKINDGVLNLMRYENNEEIDITEENIR